METTTAEPAPKPPVRPEYTPQKSPQPLSRNFETRIRQLDRITSNPTEEQIATLGTKFFLEGVDQTSDPKESARNAFENIGSLIKDRQGAEEAVKQARKDALSAPRTEFRAKVDALREAERRRDEINKNLKSFSDIFKDAGVMVEPSQQDVGLMDKVSKKAYEAGWQIAAGAHRVSETVKGRVEAVKEGGSKLIELGRRGLASLVDKVIGGANQAQQRGQATFEAVKVSAQSQKTKAEGGVSRFAQILRGAKERVTGTVSGAWEAATVWVNQRREEIATQIGKVEQGIGERLSALRASAGARIDGFTQSMRAVGEAARNRVDQARESIQRFASEQAERVNKLRKDVTDKVRGEISIALEKGKIFLEPAWESVQRDREAIREQRQMMQEKLGIMIEGVSDLASPVIDRVLDHGRDVRDASLGFAGRHTEGLRVFGRNVLRGAQETASPAWNFLQERWENLRLRTNESRARLNTFLNGVLGGAGGRFRMLKESVAARAGRASMLLSGVKIENGYIVHNGVRVSDQVGEWFMQQGTAAREFLRRNTERVGHGLDLLQRYWEVYAVGKWRESGLSDVDVKRRLKLLRGVGAASLQRAADAGGRAASIGAAATIEGGVMLQKLARDPRGRVALTLGAVALALLLNSDVRDGLQNFFSNADLANLHLPDFGAQAVSVDQGPVDVGSVSAPTPDQVGVGVPTGVAGVDVGGVPTPPDINVPSLSATPDLGPVDVGTPVDVGPLSGLTPGQPIEPQVRQLAGGVNETYYNMLQGAFDQFRDNFITTAQTIVNNPSNYTPEQVSVAQQQLQAAARIDGDPTLVQGSQAWYDTLMRAMHYWRPA